jgi:hypothetical protein
VPVEERHVLSAGSPAGAPLNLPADRPYNIHIKQGQLNKGSNGDARSDATATPEGAASASAQADNGGSANAEFKIGHRIDNNTDKVQTMAVRVNLQLQQAAKADEVPLPATLAKADLRLIVVDTHKRVVTSTVLVQATTDDAVAESASIPQERNLTARLEPGESYDVVLYGKVEAAAGERQKSAASLKLEQLAMTFTFAPAAAGPTGTGPRP